MGFSGTAGYSTTNPTLWDGSLVVAFNTIRGSGSYDNHTGRLRHVWRSDAFDFLPDAASSSGLEQRVLIRT